ncbi:MFS general substrate transporter [Fomitiporia mediterranea MF3/22]|uniref:MFS general substrate transporter n=1 Tax=Fomitiporia mediterranea (strain MF3/22) TaxID=694068 RepID=UPI00044076F7|nr:MFS general substrate transporter [Fomitiporia mediterranea MF3/22]EJD06103.1 MFS general substrate transporter [Fomitiporia mediterranea MF3/22]
MNPAHQHNPPDSDERASAASRAGSTLRRSAESHHQHHDAIETVAVSAEKKEPKVEAQTHEAEKAGDGCLNSTEAHGVEEQIEYPSGVRLALLTLGLCLVIFVVSLDNTIIATAIPTITTKFNSLDDVGWYGSSYLLTTTSLQPTFGKIYTYFNVKWTYLSALVLFEVGSVICATSRNSTTLIVGRAIAGAGASALFSGGNTIIGFSVPLRKMPIYIAMLSGMFGIASVVGPILGGVLTDRASWRWCFWINLPFGGAAFLAVLLFFKPPKRDVGNLTLRQKLEKIDILGALFLICGIICLLLALQDGGTEYPWSEAKVWGLLLGFGLQFVVFLGIQVYRGDDATIPPRVFIRQRSIFCGSVFTFFLSMALYTHIYFLPFYFQAVLGTSAEGSGIRSIPYLVSITTSSLIVGALITKIGYYVPFLWIGSAVFTVGAGLLFTLRVSTITAKWIGYQILAGFGAGAGFQVPYLAVQAVLSSQDMPTGNAIIMFSNALGGAIAISVAQNIFTNTLLSSIPKHTTGIDPDLVVDTGATHLRDVIPTDQLQGVLVAYTYALDRAFILPIAVAGSAFFTSLFVEWNTVKKKRLVNSTAA